MNKSLGTINLTQEIENRSRVSDTFDRIVDSFTKGLAPNSHEDLNTLALLLCEVREQTKLLQAHEEALKAELKRFFPKDSHVLDLTDVLVLLEPCSRVGLDKAKILTELGTDFVTKFSKTTEFEKLLAKRK